MNPSRTRHYWHALWRDTRTLVRQFRLSLLIFALLLCGGTIALRLFYVDPQFGRSLTWGEALYATFALVFLETTLPIPRSLGLQALFILIPAIGLVVVADGIVRFGMALFNRHERREAWQVAVASTYRNHIVVCGLGRTGYRVVKELIGLGEEVIGIEHDKSGQFLDAIYRLDVPILLGDARQRETLEKAGVQHASAIVICTQDDLTNLDIALNARELNKDIKVVLRMFDTQLAERIKRGFGIHTTFSTSALAAPVFAAAATRAQIEQSFYIDDVLMNVARVVIQEGAPLAGYTVGQAEAELDITIALHKRGDRLDPHPAPDLSLQAGDCLIVLASLETLARLRQMSGEQIGARRKSARPRFGLRRLFGKKQPPNEGCRIDPLKV